MISFTPFLPEAIQLSGVPYMNVNYDLQGSDGHSEKAGEVTSCNYLT